MLSIIVLVVLALLVVILIAWAIKGQNRLVHADELVGNALSQIGVQQTSRWDALSALADLTKAYSEHEYNTLAGVIAARQPVTAATTAAQVDQQEDLIGQTMQRLAVVAEAYPDLKSNTTYIQTMNSVNAYEEKVRMSRMVYNDTVTKYNRLVRSFPDSLLAGIFRFYMREYLQDDAAKAGMPPMVR